MENKTTPIAATEFTKQDVIDFLDETYLLSPEEIRTLLTTAAIAARADPTQRVYTIGTVVHACSHLKNMRGRHIDQIIAAATNLIQRRALPL